MICNQENIESGRRYSDHHKHEENWRGESIHSLLKSIDHFEEDSVVMAKQGKDSPAIREEEFSDRW